MISQLSLSSWCWLRHWGHWAQNLPQYVEGFLLRTVEHRTVRARSIDELLLYGCTECDPRPSVARHMGLQDRAGTLSIHLYTSAGLKPALLRDSPCRACTYRHMCVCIVCMCLHSYDMFICCSTGRHRQRESGWYRQEWCSGGTGMVQGRTSTMSCAAAGMVLLARVWNLGWLWN